jgi:predicted O-linked N-acetylglucosamine transferase (SPINDLY family)/cellulose synthase/poly-beta-1,6-N-acetylglucosamine synthase-like glycosyltransferase
MTLYNPLISVILTTYNHEKYISESIESVLNQTLQDFELIIVNDGSTDKTDEIIKNFRDSRIRYIYQENQGPSVATNNAILVSRGKYIALMTGDDVCDPSRLEKEYNYLSKNHKKIIFSWVNFINENSEIFSGEPYLKEGWFNRTNKTNPEVLRHFFEQGNYVNGPTAFLEREALVESGLYHLTSIQAQDFYMWIKLLARGYELYILPEKLLKFRITGRNLSLSDNNKTREAFEYRQLIKDFFKDIPADLFKEAFAHNIIRHDFYGEIEYELEKAFLYLNYNSVLFRNIGAEKLFELLQEQDVLTVAKEKYNFDLPAFYRLMTNIDKSIDIKSQPLVSVIIPCYNHANFLPEAIESVVKQTYKNWQCIIVNDGSPDNTSEVAKFLIENYKNYHILLIEKTNGGLPDARNAGIKQSSGEYILCLDADDRIGANFLEDSVAILQQNQEVGFVYTDVQYFGDKNDQVSYIDFDPNIFLRDNQATATSMFRREVFDRVGGYKTIMDGGYEDWEFWISAYENGWRGYHLAKTCFYYRKHATGSMLQNLANNKSKQQTLFARIISLHSQLYTEEEILWSKEIIQDHDNQTSTDKSLSIISVSSDGLLNEYLQFLLSVQCYFQEIGEADNYYQYLQKCIDYLHTFIFSNSDSESGYEIANNFTQATNFIPAYFNEANLKDIYVKRAEIIEYFLQLKGYKIDYEFTDRHINRRKIRIGILANSFSPSVETYTHLPIFEYMSGDFEVILYSLKVTGHSLEQYCQLSANSFKLLPQQLSLQVNTIRADDIDILFVATNVTTVTNQICLLATHRLARIQVTVSGSMVTTGMRNIDYAISGTLTDPSPTAQEQYQEKLIKLEGSAHCFSYGTEEGKITTPIQRNNLGIPENAVVFISCANYLTIIPELIETWAKIITQVPNSVLVLLPFSQNSSNDYPKLQFINHLNSIFIKYRLETKRLIVLDPQPVPDREDTKEYYKIADVYLDSFPFAGITYLIEPLQVNLPVIARQGNCFRSAMGAAMIKTLNIPDLVADSEESYIQLAVALGNNAEFRQQKSDEIKVAMQNNPSFLDSRAYSAKMGNLFQELFRNYLSENLEQNLHLRDINLIIFPDWTQSEDKLGFELQEIIQTLANHPESEKITLIIHTHNIATEEAEMFLSSVAMNLLMEDLDISDTIEISLVDNLGDMQWQSLLPRIYGRIILINEDKVALSQGPVRNLTSYQIHSLIN